MNLLMVLLLRLRSYQNCFRYECDMGRLHGRCCRILTSHIIVICWRFVSSIAVVVAVAAIVCRARHLKWLSATTKTMTALATAATIYALYRCISLLLRHRRAIKCVTILAYVRFESFYVELRSAWDSFCLVMKWNERKNGRIIWLIRWSSKHIATNIFLIILVSLSPLFQFGKNFLAIFKKTHAEIDGKIQRRVILVAGLLCHIHPVWYIAIVGVLSLFFFIIAFDSDIECGKLFETHC